MSLTIKYGLDAVAPADWAVERCQMLLRETEAQTHPFDRTDELLVFDDERQRLAAERLLAASRIETHLCELLLCETGSFEPGPLCADYEIVTRRRRTLFDLAYVAPFALLRDRRHAETEPALLQLEEHLIGVIAGPEDRVLLIDRQLFELAERIAAAYGCRAELRR